MTHTMYPLVAAIVAKLDANLKEAFEERAGIIEFEALVSRPHAESLALLDVLFYHPDALSQVIVLKAEIDGATQWLITSDLPHARQQLAAMGGNEIGVINPTEAIEQQFNGLAVLSTLI